MEDGLNELVANMKELDVEEMEEEQLNSELQRELCFSVLCERMGTRNYRRESYRDETDLSYWERCLGWDYNLQKSRYREIRYDPKLPAEFILSGKEQFQAFMEFCKSVKTLKIYSGSTAFYFDKDVCMTESDPLHEHFQKMFKSDECFFIKTLLKHVKCLEVFRGSIQGLESLYPHVTEMQNLEELVIYCCDDVNVLVKLLKMKPMKSIEAGLDVFQKLNQYVTDHKLEKMEILDICQSKDVFKLSSCSPNELHFTTYSLNTLEIVSKNKAFADTKKLFVETNRLELRGPGNTLYLQLKSMLSTAGPFINSVQKQFPKLEELVFKFPFSSVQCLDLTHQENQWKLCADWCSDFLKEYQGNMDVKFVFVWKEDFHDLPNLHEYMKKQFPVDKFEVVEQEGCIEYRWKNHFSLAKNVFIDYEVCAC